MARKLWIHKQKFKVQKEVHFWQTLSLSLNWKKIKHIIPVPCFVNLQRTHDSILSEEIGKHSADGFSQLSNDSQSFSLQKEQVEGICPKIEINPI